MSATKDTPNKRTLAEWLGAEPREPVQVTILFTDIVTSTKLSNKLGDRGWIERLLKHFNQGLQLIDKYDGYKIKFIGDSFMVAFRSPVEALDFAMDFHKEPGDKLIKIRACIHSGTARVIDDDIFGRMVNYAARMLAWKKDDGVIVSNPAKEDLIGEYGSQRAHEIFVQQTAELKDFATLPVWALNLDEWWVTRIRQDVPNFDEVCDPNCDTGCSLREATLADLEWMAKLQARTFDDKDAVSAEVLSGWYGANPHGFSIIETEGGEMIGLINILPVKSAAVALLLTGKGVETSITPDMLYTPQEQARIDVLYIESMIIKDRDPKLQSKALLTLLSSFNTVITRICTVEQVRDMYVVPVTKQGEQLMPQLGFRLVGPADERVDQHPLYVAALRDIKSNIETKLSTTREKE